MQSAEVSGRIYDASNATVPKAEVVLRNRETAAEYLHAELDPFRGQTTARRNLQQVRRNIHRQDVRSAVREVFGEQSGSAANLENLHSRTQLRGRGN